MRQDSMTGYDKIYFDAVREAQAKGEPKVTYIKTILGKLCVSTISPFTGLPTEIILHGDINNPADFDTVTVSLWTDMEVEYFKRANKTFLKDGKLQVFVGEPPEDALVNQVTDEELKKALTGKFFSVKALLDRFTSPVPVQRMLQLAEEMEVSISYINHIKRRLSELQGFDDNEAT